MGVEEISCVETMEQRNIIVSLNHFSDLSMWTRPSLHWQPFLLYNWIFHFNIGINSFGCIINVPYFKPNLNTLSIVYIL